MKRFYTSVEVGEGETGCQVLLDGRPVRTPMKAQLDMRSDKLAALVAAEWAAQLEQIQPHTMPITRLATTVIDLMPTRRRPAQAEIEDYAATDTLCYRSPEPRALATRQGEQWQPWLDWAATALDAPMSATDGIEPVDQPIPSLKAIAGHIHALDDWRLVGVHAATKIMGSAILALALNEAVVQAEEAHQLALLDELFEVERWGLEEEQANRHAELARNLAAAEAYLRALDP